VPAGQGAATDRGSGKGVATVGRVDDTGSHDDFDEQDFDTQDLDPRDFDDRHWDPRPAPQRPSAGVVIGRMMMGLEEIIEGKPPREAYEAEQEADESGEPFDPDDPDGPHTLIIEI
jgi:hypothetical protein